MKDVALRGDGEFAPDEAFEVLGRNEAADGSRLRARLVSRRRFAAGDLVAAFPSHRVVEAPSYRSVQIAADRHIEDIGMLAYLNHSCRPNLRIDVERLVLVATEDIAEGDELTFFYPATEWEMAQPFRCWCGAPGCLGWVAGAKAVPRQVLARYGVAPHIARLAKLHPF